MTKGNGMLDPKKLQGRGGQANMQKMAQMFDPKMLQQMGGMGGLQNMMKQFTGMGGGMPGMGGAGGMDMDALQQMMAQMGGGMGR